MNGICFYYLKRDLMKIIPILFFYLLSYSILYSQTDSSFYFPMKMGNLWQYKEPPPPEDPYIKEIRTSRDTTISNGQTYRSFIVDTYGYPDTGTQAYRRQIGSRVYEYFSSQQKEFLVYDFSKGIGDTVSVFPRSSNCNSIVTVFDAGVQNIFGVWRRYITFYDRLTCGSMYWIDQITDSIGITFSQIEPGLQYYLVGAIVDSIRYGNVTSISPTIKEIPGAFMLYQNFPNPCNPTTVIKYSIPENNFVTLTIYDIRGLEITRLVNTYQFAGDYNIHFSPGEFKLASGIYFYSLRTPNFQQSRKMIILK